MGYDFVPRFNLPVRAELEYGVYGRTSQSGIDYGWMNRTVQNEIKTLLVNVYWDIAEWNEFTPYIGAGRGAAFVDSQCNIYDNEYGGGYDAVFGNTETVFAWQAGLGCSYAFNDTVSVDFGYRFLMTGDGKTSATPPAIMLTIL